MIPVLLSIVRDWLVRMPEVLIVSSLAAAALFAFAAARARPPRRPPLGQRPKGQARTLVAEGRSVHDIARRTGLSRDAVALLVKREGPALQRKGRPRPARIAVPMGVPVQSPEKAPRR